MSPQLAIVLVYLLAMLAIGLLFRRRSSASTVEFFLAGRGIGRLVLFFTMAATNFSAFTIFGLSGAGYRIGYAFYPIMGFGTGFMALGMWIIGSRIRELAPGRGYITPSDFILDRYGSPALKGLFSLVMILFTLPYVAIQAIAAGRSLETLAGLPYWAGALLVMGFTALYVLLGGMRSVAWTDVVQALMILGLTLAGFLLILIRVRGLESFPGALAARHPELFSRPGLDGSMVPGVWLGYLLLWLFADPMFPQLFQRFLAARDTRALKTTVVLYPLITTFLFFLTVSIGVLGRAVFPDLSPARSESVYPLLLARFASPFHQHPAAHRRAGGPDVHPGLPAADHGLHDRPGFRQTPDRAGVAAPAHRPGHRRRRLPAGAAAAPDHPGLREPDLVHRPGGAGPGGAGRAVLAARQPLRGPGRDPGRGGRHGAFLLPGRAGAGRSAGDPGAGGGLSGLRGGQPADSRARTHRVGRCRRAAAAVSCSPRWCSAASSCWPTTSGPGTAVPCLWPACRCGCGTTWCWGCCWPGPMRCCWGSSEVSRIPARG